MYTIVTAHAYSDTVNMDRLFTSKEQAFDHMVATLKRDVEERDIAWGAPADEWKIPDGELCFELHGDGCHLTIGPDSFAFEHNGLKSFGRIVEVPGMNDMPVAVSGDGHIVSLGREVFVVTRERKINKVGRRYTTDKLVVERAILTTLSFEKDHPEVGKTNWYGTAIIRKPDTSYDVTASAFNAFSEKDKAGEMKAAMETEGYAVMAGNGDYIMLKSEWVRCRAICSTPM